MVRLGGSLNVWVGLSPGSIPIPGTISTQRTQYQVKDSCAEEPGGEPLAKHEVVALPESEHTENQAHCWTSAPQILAWEQKGRAELKCVSNLPSNGGTEHLLYDWQPSLLLDEDKSQETV